MGKDKTPSAASTSVETAPNSEQQAAVAAAIASFRGLGSLRLTFCDRSPNPYADETKSLIDIYVDDKGHEYWFDPTADRLVQVGPHAGRHQKALQVKSADRLPVARLRELALELAGKAVENFQTRRENLHPLEDNRKGQIYFFRWDDFSQPVKESEMPPFLQVALYADGRLASFTDTLRH
ncbi:MAG: hypothetical protein PHT12_01800 [Patescibacteria group bacterium]|nr:hypothetical protein [Patescibacteria group bacterium]